ncbi:MAG TPA: hypothetical protein VMH81_27535 [Bryobacteraceae bacterium]|nr:hypothetical protein [Bryobacteraceae bacterium]
MNSTRQTEGGSSGDNSGAPDSSGRLDSWKAVASYLGRSDKTVRRWEEKEGLPIHRLHHDKRGSIYAYRQELDSWWQSRKAVIEAAECAPAQSEETPAGERGASLPEDRIRRLPGAVWAAAGIVLAGAVFLDLGLRLQPQPAAAHTVRFSRLTDFTGLEESPAISPDGKIVAFVAQKEGRRHIWIRLLAGGAPVQITHEDVDHEHPRWTPDSGSLVYYEPSPEPGKQGTIWEIPALGGPPRRIAASLGPGDCSHDGKRIALFRSENGKTELASLERQGSEVHLLTEVSTEDLNDSPRWSPDDKWIAFQSHSGWRFEDSIQLVPSGGGKARILASSDDIRGLTWTSDNSAIIYSSSAGSTVLYPPAYNLRVVRLNGSGDRQLTFGDVSYLQPDMHGSEIVVSCVRNHSDVWRFPINGPAGKNAPAGTRITTQTGQIQTPSVSPDGREMVYLSDSGGHGNLWIARTDGSLPRQLTFERDPTVAVGVPIWSPAGNYIVFIRTQQGRTAEWVIHPDGSGLRELLPEGVLAYWSADGLWLYYVKFHDGALAVEKISVEGGKPVQVRSDNATSPAATDGSVLYYATPLMGGHGGWDFEFRRARPESGASEVLTRISGARIPNEVSQFQMILSPDGRWLAVPLTDGTTSNVWLLPAGGGEMRQVTDFGQKPVLIARRLSWSPDSKEIYAAVADCDSDIVMLEGLFP